MIYGPNKQAIESEIKILGFSANEHRNKFGIRNEAEVGYCLGIWIEKTENNGSYWTRLD